LKKEEDMPRIVHIAIKVDDLEKATKFYEDVFGFRQTGTGYARGHVSRHLTDGSIDLALMVYDSEDVEEARRSRSNPRSRRLRDPDQLRRRERYRPNPSLERVKIGRR
jgi:catechol 2,3-dioxygenase-like lactoylglutathione lyase family enzyme